MDYAEDFLKRKRAEQLRQDAIDQGLINPISIGDDLEADFSFSNDNLSDIEYDDIFYENDDVKDNNIQDLEDEDSENDTFDDDNNYQQNEFKDKKNKKDKKKKKESELEFEISDEYDVSQKLNSDNQEDILSEESCNDISIDNSFLFDEVITKKDESDIVLPSISKDLDNTYNEQTPINPIDFISTAEVIDTFEDIEKTNEINKEESSFSIIDDLVKSEPVHTELKSKEEIISNVIQNYDQKQKDAIQIVRDYKEVLSQDEYVSQHEALREQEHQSIKDNAINKVLFGQPSQIHTDNTQENPSNTAFHNEPVNSTETKEKTEFTPKQELSETISDDHIKPITIEYKSEHPTYLSYLPQAESIPVLKNPSTVDKFISGLYDDKSAVLDNIQEIQEKSESVVPNRESVGTTSSAQSNETSDIYNKELQRDKSTSDISQEEKETKELKSEFKEYNLHQFAEHVAIINSANRVGNIVIHNVKNEIINGDKNTSKGASEAKKYIDPIAQLATLTGLMASASIAQDKVEDLATAGKHVDKLINNKSITRQDLLNKDSLIEKLKETDLSSYERNLILKNREEIGNIYSIKDDIKSKDRILGQLTSDQKSLLESNGIFNLKNEETNKLLQYYFKNADNDTIRNVFGKNFQSKNDKTFENFLKSKNLEKNNITSQQKSAIKIAHLSNRSMNAGKKISINKHKIMNGYVKKMNSFVTSGDRNVLEAIGVVRVTTQTMGIVSAPFKKVLFGSSKHGYKGLIPLTARVSINTGKFVAKKVDDLSGNQISTKITNIQERMKKISEKNKKRINDATDLVKKELQKKEDTIKKSISKKANDIEKKAMQNEKISSSVQTYKNAQKEARELAKKASQTKAAKIASATSKTAKKGVKEVSGLFVSSSKKISHAIGSVFNFFEKIKKALIIGVAFIIGAYLLIVTCITGITSAIDGLTTTVLSVILTDREEFVGEQITKLLKKDEAKKQKAIDIGESTPINPNVYGGGIISKYGHPDKNGDWVPGYKIYYKDSSGTLIQSGTNNIKDAIILAYVQQHGLWLIESSAESLINKWYDWLNPAIDVNNSEDVKESDIYYCDGGCETIYYSCNDDITSDGYYTPSQIQDLKTQGVEFFGEIKNNSEGCYSKYVCSGECRQIYYHSSFSDCDNFGYQNGKKTCFGHYSLYYHNDNSVLCDDYTKIGKKKICNGHYNIINHGTSYNQPADGCENYTVTKYCNGHQVKACRGHKDVKIYITIKDMSDAFSNNHFEGVTGLMPGISTWSEDEIDWAEGLYDPDWEELYGVNPNPNISESVGSVLTDEEIADIMANAGNIDAKRQAIIDAALSQVGKIPYFYGGKPVASGTPINTNVGVAGNRASKADHVGRTTAGLDCFGFCEWAYWEAFGSDVLSVAKTNTTTSIVVGNGGGGLYRINASDLKPGDLGFQKGHVGIFAGVKDGKLMWVHCVGGSQANVVYGQYSGFTYFFRLTGM